MSDERFKKGFLLAVVTQTKVGAVVEKHADVAIRQLVAKAVFVGIVDPFCDPDKGLGSGETRRISGSWRRG